MKKKLTPLLFLLVTTVTGCNPPDDGSTSIDDLDDFTFCEIDDHYFEFEESEELKNTINNFSNGTLSNRNLEILLEALSLNDKKANQETIIYEFTVDYGILNVYDNKLDKNETYTKQTFRYDDYLMLVGSYGENIRKYDDDDDLYKTTVFDAEFQSYRNGYCPSVSRYFDVYDFDDTNRDFVKEYIYSTEDFIDKLTLTNGEFLAKDIEAKYNMFEESNVFDTLSFQAVKTSAETTITVEARYQPLAEMLGEKVHYSIKIKDGMITEVINNISTFEIVGGVDIPRTSKTLTKTYSVVDLDDFDGEEIAFNNDAKLAPRPIIDNIDIFI